MKNIHILPTDKPSKIALSFKKLFFNSKPLSSILYKNQNIHITNNEEIKKGDWFYVPNQMLGYEHISNKWFNDLDTIYAEKIILTTDPYLIKDGVQAIPDEFLEWFVKNPSCEEIKVEYGDDGNGYQPILPKEEPNIIDQWLEKNGNPEIAKQVEEEARKLCEHKSKFIVFTLQDGEDWVQYSMPLGSFEKANDLCQQFRDKKMSYLICQTLKQGYNGK